MVASESSNEVGSGERRKRQRFVARRWGSVCFWVVIDGERLPVNDLSLEGFSVPYGAPLIEPRQLGFELSLDGIPERIFGVAEFFQGQGQEEGGALEHLAADADAAVHHLDDVLGDGEPEPGAAVLSRRAAVPLLERMEQPGHDLG